MIQQKFTKNQLLESESENNNNNFANLKQINQNLTEHIQKLKIQKSELYHANQKLLDDFNNYEMTSNEEIGRLERRICELEGSVLINRSVNEFSFLSNEAEVSEMQDVTFFDV